jgi:hypothetical protein
MVGVKQTHIKRPSKTCQNFKSITFEKKIPINETSVKLYAQASVASTAGSRKWTILVDRK